MTDRRLRIALYQPDIAGNTGTIIRMAACLGLSVDIIEPAGFDTSDRNLKRAGMDYLDLASVKRHDDFAAFETWRAGENRRLVLFSTKAERSYVDFAYRPDDILMFGRESAGVPDSVHEKADERVTIRQVAGRSLNLAVSAAMAAGEAVRQVGPVSTSSDQSLANDLDARLLASAEQGDLNAARDVLLAYRARGFSRDQVYAFLTRTMEARPELDAGLRDIADIVTDFCPPDQRVW